MRSVDLVRECPNPLSSDTGIGRPCQLLRSTWRTSFEELSMHQVRAKISKTLSVSKLGVMALRSQVSLDIRNKNYTGEYEIAGGVLHVFFEGRNKSSAFTGPNPELLARLLLIELVFQAPSWREPSCPPRGTHNVG